ncbi:hypothetical protein BO71DRAFT_149401 [Aspergillus ellipticus CBS 707.79]|uniref:Zn(2)-C6 fungal-type domain-containing protein n=1 Tax=Aspergillus ellipticus CBS 707.79 TaxID=1448320 RepID=A0A319DJL4_9EURO|nr:hypothetical protein BO71DRAFT_149401 [Aspergillus ellipticus CBS 707.79]
MEYARISCARCREVKRKCSRDLPKCRRCCSMGIECCYPQRKKRAVPEPVALTHPRDPHRTLFTRCRTLPVVGQLPLLAQSSPETRLAWQSSGLRLLDVYFSHFLPGTILFHQDRIRRRYLEGQLPTLVLHAMFAMASLFLGHARTPTHSFSHPPHEPDGMILDCRHHGRSWADDASYVASRQLQRPSLDTVRTMYNLTVYWFAVGQTEKFQICANMALQAARDLASESDRLPLDQSRSLRWCCFWTDMACRCFVLDDSFASPARLIDISDVAVGKMLPTQEPDSQLAPTLVEIQPTRAHEMLLKTVSLWRDVRWFIRNLDPAADATERWAALFALDSKVCSHYESFPASLREVKSGGREAPEMVLALQALYHQCRALPHLTMFMFLQQAPAPAEYKQMCARIATRHFNAFADTVTKFLSLGSANAAAAPPYVAYCAFLTASIHLSYLGLVSLPFTGEQDVSRTAMLKRWALSSLLLLRRLQCYWSSCQEMCRRLEPFCQTLGISLSDLHIHGRAIQEEFLHGFHLHKTQCSSPEREELESAMSSDMARIVQALDLSHPAYCGFRKLQSAAPAPITSADSPETFPNSPCDGCEIPAEVSHAVPLFDIQSTYEETVPEDMPTHESIAEQVSRKSTCRPASRPRTWIAARPPPSPTQPPVPMMMGFEPPNLLNIDPSRFWDDLGIS